MFYSLVLLYLLSSFADVMAWGTVITLQLGSIAGSATCFLLRKSLLNTSTASTTKTTGAQGVSSGTSTFYSHEPTFLLIMGIGLAIFGFVLLMLLACRYKHIKTAISVFNASAAFILQNKRIFLLPLIYFALTIASWGLGIYCVLNALSLNRIENG